MAAAAGCAAGVGSRRITGLSLAPASLGASILTSLDLASVSGLVRSAVPVSTRGASSVALSAAGSDLAESALGGGSILAGSLAIGGSSAPGWLGLADRLSLRPSGPRSIAAWGGVVASSAGSP